MATFLDGTEVYDHGSGTATMMYPKYDEQTCICMWDELAEAEQVKNFDDLITLWYRNLEEYVVTGTGTVASGELPFAVQFLSPGWFPTLKVKKLQKLRDHFCAIDKTTKKRESCREPLRPSSLSAIRLPRGDTSAPHTRARTTLVTPPPLPPTPLLSPMLLVRADKWLLCV